MPRTQLSPDNVRLIAALQRMRQMAGWTIAEQAEALDLSPQTLRGILHRADRAGPRVLDQVLAFTLRMNTQMGAKSPAVIIDLRDLAVRLLRPYHRWLADRLLGRVMSDFQSEDELLAFLGVAPDEWRQFTAGEHCSPAVLQAIARVYRAEAQRLNKQERRGVRWCEETAALAERLLTFL